MAQEEMEEEWPARGLSGEEEKEESRAPLVHHVKIRESGG